MEKTFRLNRFVSSSRMSRVDHDGDDDDDDDLDDER